MLTSKKNLPEAELVRRAAEQGVRVYGLIDSMKDAEACKEYEDSRAGTILLGFGALNREQIEEGVGRLHKAWL